MAPATKRGVFPRPTVSTSYSAPVEVLHRTSKWGEVRRLACPLRRFPFAAPPNCGGGKGTGFIGESPRPANPVTCFPPGKVVAPATKGGMHFQRPQGGCKGFIQPGAFYKFRGANHNPLAIGASNLSPLRTFGPAGRQPASPNGACAHHNPQRQSRCQT